MGVINTEVNAMLERPAIFADLINDALEYRRQIQELEKAHRERKELKSSEELLSGITREDRLCPVINLVLYLGKEWDGSRSLHEMLELDPENKRVKELLPYIADYRLNIIPVRAIKDPENYRSCLQQIFCMLKLNEDKEQLYNYVNAHKNELDRMDSVEMSAAFAMLGEQKRLQKLMRGRQEGEELSMSKAIEDLILDGEKRGEKRGKKLGEERGEKRGQERMAHLIMVLSENHKEDLILKAASDIVLRRKLFKEYNI